MHGIAVLRLMLSNLLISAKGARNTTEIRASDAHSLSAWYVRAHGEVGQQLECWSDVTDQAKEI